MQINDANLRDLYRGYRTLFDTAMQGAMPVSGPILMEVPSSNNEEKYVWLGAVPGMRRLLDEIQIKNLSASNYTIPNGEFEDTIGIKQQDIENDNYGIYNPFFTAMGEAASYDKDIRTIPLLLGGFSVNSVIDSDGTLSGPDYTGTAFFAAGKKRTPGDPGFTNIFVAGGNITANAPLNVYSYRAARANLKGRMNAAGRPMNLGRKLILLCGTELEYTALQILQASTALTAMPAAGGGNAFGSVENIDKGTAQVITSPLIDASATPNAWFLLEVGLAVKPLVWQVNKAPTLTSITQPNSDHVLKHHEFLYQAYGRYAAGYLLSDLAFGSTGAGAAMTQYP
jgi:phage major head subunit gpT-like protein